MKNTIEKNSKDKKSNNLNALLFWRKVLALYGDSENSMEYCLLKSAIDLNVPLGFTKNFIIMSEEDVLKHIKNFFTVIIGNDLELTEALIKRYGITTV